MTEENDDDEYDEPVDYKATDFGCNDEEFQCVDNTCISVNQLCDNKDDCPDGSDEMRCPFMTGSTNWEGSFPDQSTASTVSGPNVTTEEYEGDASLNKQHGCGFFQ